LPTWKTSTSTKEPEKMGKNKNKGKGGKGQFVAAPPTTAIAEDEPRIVELPPDFEEGQARTYSTLFCNDQSPWVDIE
jgi:hypothetical protein